MSGRPSPANDGRDAGRTMLTRRQKPWLIVRTGEKIPALDSLPGDYPDWIWRGLTAHAAVAGRTRRVVAPYAGERLPSPEETGAALITGSGAMVTEGRRWMRETAAWLNRIVERNVPVLGICFGHQLLAYALGGRVDDNPRGVEVGTVPIRLAPEARDDELLGGLPATFFAQVSHRQSVVQLPAGARLLARSAMEGAQAFRVDGCRAWGLQFHPEFSARVIPAFIRHYQALGDLQEGQADAALRAVEDTPHSASVLRRFAALALARDDG